MTSGSARTRPSTGSPATAGAAVEALPAATVVLLRPGPAGLETLLTHRPPTMAFAADIHVFPACGHIARSGKGYELVPAEWQPL